ncbi:MAG TPA: nicotinate-nucleotide--dimethylbenzimidazole phosphoribosyltransferase [Polyangia bacterium]|nr:nicotinate-nucleotide--dimethylbenzimidazole phosphoribosyltransferase [Polyangia bacterium]
MPGKLPPAATDWSSWASDLPAFDEEAAAAARRHQTQLTKPPGSLGRLEDLGVLYAGARGRFPVAPPARARIYVFAADHGVAAEGVSPYPSSVTAAMVANFVAGGAAISVLTRAHDIELAVVDVGVASPIPGAGAAGEGARLVSRPVRAGTASFLRGPAMSRAEAEAALGVGLALAEESAAEGVELLGAGEMGIGNTTAAAAVVAALTGASPDLVVGRGTGVDDVGLVRKIDVVSASLDLHALDGRDVLGVLAAVGGLEIAAMAGLMLGGARRRVPVVVDGFISGAAALVATRLAPGVRDYLFFSHLSAERGHRIVCEALDARPLLDLGMRLGEGTGAALAISLLRAAVRLQSEMATFESAGVANRD